MNIYEMKLTLAKGIRMLDNIGLLDMNGHFSFRIPGEERILINARNACRATITVEDIVIADLENNLIEGNNEPPSEVHIHTAIYRFRKDVNAVVHNHPHWQTILGVVEQPIQPVFSIGAFGDIPIYEKSSLINTKEMGDELAEQLGQSTAILLRHHGTVTVDKDIHKAFVRSVFMEENARKQYYASLLGSYRVMEGQNLIRTAESNWSSKIVKKVWDYHEGKAIRDGIFVNMEKNA